MIDADVRISILGCGWLGWPLGGHLLDRGLHVRGSTTTNEKLGSLRDDDIEPYLLRLNPELGEDEARTFFSSDILVLNVPPSRDSGDVVSFHRQQIDSVRSAAAAGSVDWILFVSSTGVYPSVEQVVTEDDLPPGMPDALPGPRRSTGRALLQAEGRLMNDPNFDTTVVRFGGFYGDDRHPGRFLAGRSEVSRPEAPVNLIHRDDCVGLLSTLIEQGIRNEVFNACADGHPTRRSLYTRAIEVLGLEPPTFDDSDTRLGKLVRNDKVKQQCGYEFEHPDPLADLERLEN